MRVCVLGGTRLLGRALVAELLAAEHAVAVVHRGVHEADLPAAVEHLHLERGRLQEHRRELARLAPDAVIDLSAMTAGDAAAAVGAFAESVATVVVSSADVYRACESVAAGTVTDPAPLAESAALRTGPTPYREELPPGWAYEPAAYEKLDVERIYLEREATVCRLPVLYGEQDYARREEFILRRVRAGRRRIPVGPGGFLWSRGYAPEVARGLRLAAERASASAGPQIFNLAERSCAPIRLWAEEILAAAGHDAELVRVPDESLPPDLQITAEIAQPWQLDSSKAERDLGWAHAPWRECVQRSVRWHLENPPADAATADFDADDRSLAAAN